MKRHLLWLIPLILVLAFALFPKGVSHWDGKTRKTISVQVIDNESYRPISGATVYLQLWGDHQLRDAVPPEKFQKALRDETRLVTTNGDGRADVIALFGAGGSRRFLHSTASFVVDARLHITHPDFSPTDGLLQSYLGANRLPLSTSKLQVTIYLTRPNASL